MSKIDVNIQLLEELFFNNEISETEAKKVAYNMLKKYYYVNFNLSVIDEKKVKSLYKCFVDSINELSKL